MGGGGQQGATAGLATQQNSQGSTPTPTPAPTCTGGALSPLARGPCPCLAHGTVAPAPGQWGPQAGFGWPWRWGSGRLGRSQGRQRVALWCPGRALVQLPPPTDRGRRRKGNPSPDPSLQWRLRVSAAQPQEPSHLLPQPPLPRARREPRRPQRRERAASPGRRELPPGSPSGGLRAVTPPTPHSVGRRTRGHDAAAGELHSGVGDFPRPSDAPSCSLLLSPPPPHPPRS